MKSGVPAMLAAALPLFGRDGRMGQVAAERSVGDPSESLQRQL